MYTNVANINIPTYLSANIHNVQKKYDILEYSKINSNIKTILKLMLEKVLFSKDKNIKIGEK